MGRRFRLNSWLNYCVVRNHVARIQATRIGGARKSPVRILWVKAGKLLPVDTGGKIRSYNILRQLARAHEVTLLSYYGGKKDSDYETAIQAELPGAHTIWTAALDGSALAQS